ncbi:unnamed protein product, partial [Enterobius vermicularis]|uniref:Uncharacterized protein n=1 Tax=Enterobius vermicularis TaxID=51028 RepID=A0A0N4VN19_ENTVE
MKDQSKIGYMSSTPMLAKTSSTAAAAAAAATVAAAFSASPSAVGRRRQLSINGKCNTDGQRIKK